MCRFGSFSSKIVDQITIYLSHSISLLKIERSPKVTWKQKQTAGKALIIVIQRNFKNKKFQADRDDHGKQSKTAAASTRQGCADWARKRAFASAMKAQHWSYKRMLLEIT